MRDRFGIFGTVIRIRKLSLLLVMMLMLTPFLGTCTGWQNKMAVCGLQDELPMRIVADKGKVERD